jgi:hypothetical protein
MIKRYFGGILCEKRFEPEKKLWYFVFFFFTLTSLPRLQGTATSRRLAEKFPQWAKGGS